MHATYTEEEPNALAAHQVPMFLQTLKEQFAQHYAMAYLGFARRLVSHRDSFGCQAVYSARSIKVILKAAGHGPRRPIRVGGPGVMRWHCQRWTRPWCLPAAFRAGCIAVRLGETGRTLTRDSILSKQRDTRAVPEPCQDDWRQPWQKLAWPCCRAAIDATSRN